MIVTDRIHLMGGPVSHLKGLLTIQIRGPDLEFTIFAIGIYTQKSGTLICCGN